jgi:hypothetical protein
MALTLATGLDIQHRHEAMCLDAMAAKQAENQLWKEPSDIELFSRAFVDDTMNGISGPKNRSHRGQEQQWMSRATLSLQ